MKDKDGNTIKNEQEILKRWKEYVEDLYNKDRKPKNRSVEETSKNDDEEGPPILRKEVEWAIKALKAKKAAGIDEVPAEVLKIMEENGINSVWKLCQRIYETGIWPEDFTTAVMITLPKKPNANECKFFRTISLISHTSKILLKILHARMQKKIDTQFGYRNTQFGYRSERGTRDAIGAMRQLTERRLEIGRDTYICFIDFEKAFDKLNWTKMLEIMKNIGIDHRDRRLVENLYMNQTSIVRVNNVMTERCIIGQGVRQGCLISPQLFSLYAEKMMEDAYNNCTAGVKVGGKKIRDIRFADDQAMIGDSEEELQEIISRLHNTAKEYKMKINMGKTKVMCVTREPKVLHLKIENEKLEQVKSFVYLGATISEDGTTLKEVKTRIAIAKSKMKENREIMTSNLSIDLKSRLIKTLIWSIATYGAETWTLNQETIRRIESFEMWCWRRMLKVKWTEKKTNAEVLKEAHVERSLLTSIKKRKHKWLGHIMRHEGLLKDIIEGKMDGKRRKGRPRLGMMSEMGDYSKLKRNAEDRRKWYTMARTFNYV